MFLQCLLLALIPFVQAQTPDPGNPGVENTDPSCGIAGTPSPGQVYYYSPNDTLPLGEYVTTTGTCTPNSYGRTTLNYPSPNTVINGNVGSQFCGYQPLNGQYVELDCPGLTRGTIPEGTYTWVTETGVASWTGTFTVYHTQVTASAPTPVVFVTITPSTTINSTSTSTETDTVTSAQATVTSPAATAPNTVSVRPHRSTTHVTLTRTFTVTRIHFSVAKTTTTLTRPCETWHPRMHGPPRHHGGGGHGRGHNKTSRWMPRALARRFDDLGGIYSGDGPLTTTVTPAPSVSTLTASTTTTVTDVVPTVVTTTTMAGFASDFYGLHGDHHDYYYVAGKDAYYSRVYRHQDHYHGGVYEDLYAYQDHDVSLSSVNQIEGRV